ncbi:MAG: polysaccharide deacetylase family protein [Flavobacteriales bacterium]|nr:polysaccharide deacetylase family protein [Flavobacteriales bacterium]
MLTHRRTLFPLLAMHVLLISGALFGVIAWWPAIALLLAHGTLLAYASLSPGLGFFVPIRGRGRAGTLALTYDDGPDPAHTGPLLDLLQREGVKAAFFCIGSRVEAHPELVRRMVHEGHLVGGHTQDHPWNWGFLSEHRAVEQILRCVDTIEKASGMRTTWFRPPFGVTSPTVAAAIRSTGMTTVGWDVRSYDTTYRTVAGQMKWLFDTRPKGTIAVLHDRMPTAVETTKAIIEKCRSLHVPLVRVDESLGRTN